MGFGADAHRVAVVALDSVSSFELLAVLEVFGAANTAAGRRLYEVEVVTAGSAARAGMEHGAGSFVLPAVPIGAARSANTLVVPGHERYREPLPESVVELLWAGHERRARIVALGTGTFLVAATGILDGRAATTHWAHAEELAEVFPALRVRAEPLFVRDGHVYTGAGGSTAVDFALHLVEQQYGSLLAATVTSDLVAPDRRQDAHPQQPRFRATQQEDPLRPTLDWAHDRLADGISIDDLARHAHMSRRSFDRHFRASTGITPLSWLIRQRLRRAEELLLRTTWPIDRVAHASGFHTEAALRHHFSRALGLTPGGYRRTRRLDALAVVTPADPASPGEASEGVA